MKRGSLREDLTGRQFSRLTVLSMYQRVNSRNLLDWMCRCRCDCGNEVDVLSASLKKGLTRTCGQHRKYWANSGENHKGYTGYKGISGKAWSTIKRRATNRNLSFDLTIEYAWDLYEAQGRICALSGIPIVFGGGKAMPASTASLDRIDGAKGYEVGNVQWVHKAVNIMRNVYTVEEYVEMCRRVADHAGTSLRNRGRDPAVGDQASNSCSHS